MLKKRITKWNLDKNFKHTDMSAALSIALAREAQGKKSIFLYRGRLITFDDIKHYFKRKCIHDLHAMVAGRTASKPESLITCYTPPATPESSDTIGSGFVDVADANKLFLEGRCEHFRLIDTAGSVPPSARTTERIQAIRHLATPAGCLEQLLMINSSYYDSVFEDPDWMEEESSFEVDALELFYHYMTDGQAFLDAGNGTLAFETFNCAFELIRDILRGRILLFLPYIYHMMMIFGGLRNQEVISHLLGFIGQMTEECCCQSHPIKHAVSTLGRMLPKYRAFSAHRVLQSALDRMSTKIEPMSLDSSHWHSICPRSPHEPSEELISTYQKTAIALQNLIMDVDIFSAAMETGGQSVTDLWVNWEESPLVGWWRRSIDITVA
jgi:hypothetical protein